MIHPSMIFAMMGSSVPNDDNDDSDDDPAGRRQTNSRDIQKAVANMERAVAGAVLVSLDQEVQPQQDQDGEEQGGENLERSHQESTKKRLSVSHSIWIAFQLAYSLYMIGLGVMLECNDIDTLRSWSVTWGIATLLGNVVAPLRGWNDNQDTSAAVGSNLLVAFVMLYIWGSSAIFANLHQPTMETCNPYLHYAAFWSIVCGLGITLAMIVAGFVWTKCGCTKHIVPRNCPMTMLSRP